MGTRFQWSRGFALLILLALLAACSSKTTVESDLGIKGAPDWVNEGTNILKTKNGRLFHGVGSAPPLGDFSLQTSTADNRARAEVARILSSYMEIVSRDYIASGKADEAGFTEQSVSRQIDNITKINLTGVRIIGHWRDKKTDRVYAIAELDMNQVKKTLEGVEAMNSGLKDYLDTSGGKIFDRIATRREE